MKRLVIFAGYNEKNIIEDYVIYYIKELKKIADIIYVSNCYFDNNELNKISEYCLEMICKPHGEYDFGSYKRGYIFAEEQNILKDYDYLLLCNDSVFGPFFDLKTIVENMENKNFDVWGMFKYLEDNMHQEHLQSYFIAMKNNVFTSKEYNNFIRSITKETDKGTLIFKYEIGQSILFKRCNYTMGYFLDSSIKSNININNNVLLFDPFSLIKNGFPFLKIFMFNKFFDIKSKNFIKMDVDYLCKIIDIIKEHYDIKLIIDYLNKNNIIFPKYKEFRKYFISKKLLYVELAYNNSKNTKFLIKLFNSIRLTILIPNKYLCYKNFNFIYK